MQYTTAQQLRELYGAPLPRAARKKAGYLLDHHSRTFIAASPFLLLATSDGAQLDVSPKGDEPGFVHVADDRHLMIPDWPGNRLIDGLLNVVETGLVGMIFLIPTIRETLRVNGSATIHDDPEMLRIFERKGRLPITVLRVTTEEVWFHCSRSMMRSRLWDPSAWPADRPVAPLNVVMRDQKYDDSPLESEDDMLARFGKSLY